MQLCGRCRTSVTCCSQTRCWGWWAADRVLPLPLRGFRLFLLSFYFLFFLIFFFLTSAGCENRKCVIDWEHLLALQQPGGAVAEAGKATLLSNSVLLFLMQRHPLLCCCCPQNMKIALWRMWMLTLEPRENVLVLLQIGWNCCITYTPSLYICKAHFVKL